MNGQIIEQLGNGSMAGIGGNRAAANKNVDYQETIRANIATFHARSRAGLWGILAFMAASILALVFRSASVFEPLPAAALELLGDPLPVLLVHGVLAVSTISSFIIIMGRIAEGGEAGKCWQLVMFRIFFYLLYLSADALDRNLPLVLASGLLILGMDHLNRWLWCRRMIKREKEVLRKLALWPLAAQGSVR